MHFQEVDVRAYAGYRANERPGSFVVSGARREVVEIVDRWYEGGAGARSVVMNYFKVTADDGQQYILCYNGLFDSWSMLIKE